MNIKRLLVFTVMADAILSIASFVIDFTGFALREPDENYYQSLQITMPTLLALIFVALLATSWVGLLLFWNPARYCYLGAWAITLIQYATADSYKAPGWLYALYNVVALLGGILIALIFFSDLRKLYGPRPDEAPQPTTATQPT